jgi:hypothetical protein
VDFGPTGESDRPDHGAGHQQYDEQGYRGPGVTTAKGATTLVEGSAFGDLCDH